MTRQVAGMVASLWMLMCCFVSTAGAAGPTARTATPSFVEVVWSQTDALGHAAIYYADRKQGAPWSEPVKITNDQFDNMHPVIADGPDGRKWVVWSAVNQPDFFIHYSILVDGVWSAPRNIPSGLSSNTAPFVAVDDSNVVWVVWSGNDGVSNDEIYFSRFRAGKWDAPVRLNPKNEVPDILPQITVIKGKPPVVTWLGFRNGEYHRLQSSYRGASWNKPVEISNAAEATIEQTARKIALPAAVKHPESVFIHVIY